MRPVGDKYLEQLKKSGLIPAGPFSSTHTLAHAYWIHKPVTAEGNSVPGYKSGFVASGSESIDLNAPSLLLMPEGDKWVVWMQEGVPTMLPGDFKNSWDTEQEAVDDILEFYFGNPGRMTVISNRIKQ